MNLSEEGLPKDVEAGIVSILGCKTGRIDHGKARIVAIDAVLFDQLHAYSPGLLTDDRKYPLHEQKALSFMAQLIAQTFLFVNSCEKNV